MSNICLFMSIGQIVLKSTIKNSIVNDLIEFFFENHFIIFGGCIRDYIIDKNKIYPNDFDIGVDDITTAKNILLNGLQFTFRIEVTDIYIKNKILMHSKFILTHKHITSSESLNFIIDMSHKSVIGSNLDFDINAIYMPFRNTFSVISVPNNLILMDIIDNIYNKTFRVLKIYEPPNTHRNINNIAISSLNLIEFIKIMYRTIKMIRRGWKLKNQKLQEIFNPCLIKEIDCFETCIICATKYEQYELELECCKQVICFECALGHIKARYSNSDISCPFCRGDPFGWKTNIDQNPDSISLGIAPLGFSRETLTQNIDEIINHRLMDDSYEIPVWIDGEFNNVD